VTLTRYLISKQQAIKDATGDFTLLISAIQTACKFIGTKVRRAGIANLQGLGGGSPTSSSNLIIVGIERETSLYEIANEVFINVITSSHKACAIASY
jgi:fructose-1,6-bisphosphatase I